MSNTRFSAKYVVLTSDEPWSDVWHTQLHYAFQLSKRLKVLFVGPPASWEISHLWKFNQQSRLINQNLEVVTYVNFLPALLGSFSLSINDWLNSFLIRKKLKWNERSEGIILWHFDRYRSIRLFNRSSSVKHIYHVIDPQANLNGDIELSQKADLVVVTSPRFVEHYLNLNSNVVQLGQGVDLDLFNQNGADLNTTDLISYNSIMLLGTLTDSIDFLMLQNLARIIPYNICLIGPDKIVQPKHQQDFKNLCSFTNVHWLGAMPPIEFRKHLYACKVGIITYNHFDDKNNNLRSPLKVISYIACGKCVISNINCEIPELDNKAVYSAIDQNSFVELIKQAYADHLFFDTNLVNTFLKSVNYKSLVKIIFDKLGIKLPES